jgi:hypothetical protein
LVILSADSEDQKKYRSDFCQLPLSWIINS